MDFKSGNMVVNADNKGGIYESPLVFLDCVLFRRYTLV